MSCFRRFTLVTRVVQDHLCANHRGSSPNPRSLTGSGHHHPCIRVEHRDNVDIAILGWARVLGCSPLSGPVAPSFLHLHFTLRGHCLYSPLPGILSPSSLSLTSWNLFCSASCMEPPKIHTAASSPLLITIHSP